MGASSSGADGGIRACCRFCAAEFSGRQQGGILFGAYVVVWLWLACDAVRDSGRSL